MCARGVCVCVCTLYQLRSLWADFVGECVWLCSLSVKLLVSRLLRGVRVCSLSVRLLVSRLRWGVCVCVCAFCQLSSLWADFIWECVCVCVCALCQLSSFWADVVRKCVCVCVLSVNWAPCELTSSGVCVCVCSPSVMLLVSWLCRGVFVCVCGLCQ